MPDEIRVPDDVEAEEVVRALNCLTETIQSLLEAVEAMHGEHKQFRHRLAVLEKAALQNGVLGTVVRID